MKRPETQKGFTLVELAIVMTIIGLLIGGILKGQELMENARVTSTISQVKAYEAATTTFRDSFNAFPGDMPNAQNRVPNCNANCDPPAASRGNSIIGAPGWAAGGYAIQLPVAGMTNPPAAAGDETQLYWIHLLQSDLISGVTDAAIQAVTVPSWGITHPTAKIGGGFVVGYGDGTAGLGMPAVTVGPAGTTLVMTTAPNTLMDATAAANGQRPLSPSRAAQIDRKMDDGKPGAGFVQAWGFQGAAAAGADICIDNVAPPNYFEANTAKSCGLIFRIQG